ncbi:unnamed protein product [Durusdinium trenchii]|uniref:Ammonium transporter AmtB-like domain-containing protein n=1 Tax=Durusdinium trenchii TaxID=1381693 RepID=A0ABP0SR38_9DINO
MGNPTLTEDAVNTGAVAWVLTSAALVFLMTAGLGFFYGGLVRDTNVINTMMMSVASMAIVCLTWVVFGFSWAFGDNGATGFGMFVGNFDYSLWTNLDMKMWGDSGLPGLCFAAFQMTFAIIASAIISGSLVERMRFSAYSVMLALWSLLIYAPLCHWVWGPGALDFAGGTVVHISSGVSGLVAGAIVGPRRHVEKELGPANAPFVILGGSLLWFGWLGFNGGSALSVSDGVAARAVATTFVAAASSMLTWLVLERLLKGKSSSVGASVGAVAGLVCITPGAGFVTPGWSIAIGALGAAWCYVSVEVVNKVNLVDDTLDAFGLHGMGGIGGAIFTGIFALDGGLIYTGNFKLLGKQIAGAMAGVAFSAIGTAIIVVALKLVMKLRIPEDQEVSGLSESALIVSVSQLTSRPALVDDLARVVPGTAASFSEDATVFATLLKPQLLAAGQLELVPPFCWNYHSWNHCDDCAARDSVLGNYTHYLIYAASSLAEQSFPFALLIEDTDASVSSIHFDGQDLDFYDLGGELSWLAPNDTERVDAYLAYLASGASGLGRSQLGEALPPEAREEAQKLPFIALLPLVLKLHVPANTPRGNFTHFTVFTRSVLVEQTTPAFLAIQDEASRANNVSFVDDDLDEGEIGGNLTWLAPEDFSEVVDYVIYIAEDRFGANRSLLGNVSFDTFSFLVPENTPLLDHSHLLIYARSTLEEQSTPASVVIIETVASVSNITFVDLDLDAGELGGRITFKAPASERVVSYVTYLALSLQTASGRWEIEEMSHRVTIDIPADTALLNFSYILVYTKSLLAEQSTPVAFTLEDSIASASGVAFYDRDLDEGDVGGDLYWFPPSDTSLVDFYEIYFANGTAGHWTKQHQSTVAVGHQSLHIPADTSLMSASGGMLTHLLVYTRSSLVEQSTPSSHFIADEYASVSNISFTDLDLDASELGGVVLWSPPTRIALVESIHLYLADSTEGNFRSQVGDGVQANASSLDILYDTSQENFSHVVMYTRSSLKEQTTPVALTLSDTFAIVSNVSFVDYDLDLGEIGGPITWDGSDVAEVTGYAVYLARAAPAFGEARFCAYAWESLRATGAVIENAEILGSDSMAGEWASGGLCHLGKLSAHCPGQRCGPPHGHESFRGTPSEH